MPQFVTEDQVKQALADILQVAVGTLQAYWARIVADAREAAYQDILGALTARGYSAGQIAQWDRGAEFQRDIALYWCGVKRATVAAQTQGQLLDRLDRLDRRKELATVAVMIGGVVVDPAGTTGGGIVSSGDRAASKMSKMNPGRRTTWEYSR